MKQNTQIRWELVNTGENTNNCWLCRVCNETESDLERLIFQILNQTEFWLWENLLAKNKLNGFQTTIAKNVIL